MCVDCEKECVQFFGESIAGYQSVLCKNLISHEPPIVEPLVDQHPSKRFNRRQFGIALFRLRDANGMTQHDVANRVGISLRAWRAIECGRAVPKIDTVAVIAEVFDTTVDELLNPERLGRFRRGNVL